MKKSSFLIMFICSIFLFYKYIAQLYPTLIASDLMNQYYLSAVQVAILASSYYYSYSIMQVFSGFIVDKFDIRIPAFLAILIVAIPIFLFSHTNNFYFMCFYRCVMGAGASFATVLYVKSAACWFDPRMFSIISSFLATAAMLGATIGSTPVAKIFETLGWRHGLEFISFLGIIIAFIALIFLTKKSPDNESTLEKKTLSRKEILSPFYKKENWLLMSYAGLTFAPIIILGGLWGTPFLTKKFSIEVTQASYLLSSMFLGVGSGALVWAFITTKLNNKKDFMYICNLLSILLLVLIIYPSLSYFVTLILFFLLGFSSSVFMVSFDLCRIYNSVQLIGIASAFMNSGEGIVASILEPLIGKILDIRKGTNPTFSLYDFKVAFSLILFCFILSSICLLFIRVKENSFFFKRQNRFKLSIR